MVARCKLSGRATCTSANRASSTSPAATERTPVDPGGAYFGFYSDFGDVNRGEIITYGSAVASATASGANRASARTSRTAASALNMRAASSCKGSPTCRRSCATAERFSPSTRPHNCPRCGQWKPAQFCPDCHWPNPAPPGTSANSLATPTAMVAALSAAGMNKPTTTRKRTSAAFAVTRRLTMSLRLAALPETVPECEVRFAPSGLT